MQVENFNFLKVCTFNCLNFKANSIMVKKLIDDNDVSFLLNIGWEMKKTIYSMISVLQRIQLFLNLVLITIRSAILAEKDDPLEGNAG